MSSIQYTVRGVSPDLDAALRREARAHGKTLNALVIETLEQAKLPIEQKHDDLDWFFGAARSHDKEMDAALAWLDALPTEPA
jgi:HicB family